MPPRPSKKTKIRNNYTRNNSSKGKKPRKRYSAHRLSDQREEEKKRKKLQQEVQTGATQTRRKPKPFNVESKSRSKSILKESKEEVS